jgi:hypothetical protein
VGTRFSLPPGQRIKHNQEYTFAFDVVAPVSETFAATELQMVNQKTGWFGEPRYYPVNIGDDSLGKLRLEPESGPPRTVVTANLVSGPPIPEPARGRFSFGDPKAAPYSRVAVTTTRVSSVQATFVVPSDAGCGEYYYTIRKGPNSDDPSQPQYEPSLFTVTGPCDPTRRNSITVFNYNIQFLANTACTALSSSGRAEAHLQAGAAAVLRRLPQTSGCRCSHPSGSAAPRRPVFGHSRTTTGPLSRRPAAPVSLPVAARRRERQPRE